MKDFTHKFHSNGESFTALDRSNDSASAHKINNSMYQNGYQTNTSLKRNSQELSTKTPVQRYNIMKRQIIQNLKSKQYWPEDLKKPEQFREFYWAPDLSFCGFATSGTLVKRQESQHQHQQQKSRENLIRGTQRTKNAFSNNKSLNQIVTGPS